jgi:hypothetical protein
VLGHTIVITQSLGNKAQTNQAKHDSQPTTANQRLHRQTKNDATKTTGATISPELENTPSQNPATPNATPKNMPQTQQADAKTAK